MSDETLPFDAERIELSGKNLVEASAGTGKTHAVATLFRRLVVERGFDASSILVVTFTEAATTELRERVRAELARVASERAAAAPSVESERLRRALEGIDEAPISTIHGFCQRVLNDYALKSGVSFGAELVPDLEKLYDDVLYDFWNRAISGAGPELVEALGASDITPGKLRRLLGELRKKPRVPLVPPPDPFDPLLVLLHDFERYTRSETAERKERRGVLGFEDLLERVHAALVGRAGDELKKTLRARFRAVLVDEFQDTDPTQAEIFERVFAFGEHPMFLIGDPKQAIYSFRGADVFGYLAAGKGARRFGMGTNWRSDPGVVAAVNSIFARPGAFFTPGIGYQPVEPRPGARNGFAAPAERGALPLDIVFVPRSDPSKLIPKPRGKLRMARLAAADIAALLKSGATVEGVPVVESDIAVLTRTNDECFMVQDALREYGVHSVVIGDKSVFDSDEGAELEFVLGAVLEPGRASLMRQALATRLFGEDADAIGGIDADASRLQGWLERFRAWNALWVERGFMRMFRALLGETRAAERLLARPGGERRLTNVLHLAELLHRAAVAEHLGPAALVGWLADQRGDNSSARAEHAEIRLESDERAVRLLTVHKAKGLEFPIVYCPFLWAGGIFPQGFPLAFHDDAGRAFLDVNHQKTKMRDKNKEAARRDSFAEELRVVYVALTRAKRRTTIFWGGFRYAGGSPAAHLFFPPPEKERGKVPVSTRLDKCSDAALLADLQKLEAVGVASIRRLDWDFDTAPLVRAPSAAKTFSALGVERPVRKWRRVDSFSALVQHVLSPAADDDELARDRDEGIAEPVLRASPPEGAERIVLDGFPHGRVSGNFFHAVLENVDFETCTGADLLDVVTEKLEAFGLARGAAPAVVDQLLARAVESLRDVLDTPLGAAGGARLRDVPKARRFSELEFHVPVALGSAARLDRKALAAVFREYPSPELPPAYAESVERLGFEPLSGFLKGYIDLVFVHGGRWYVVDYKTNHLSDFTHEYDRERMTAAMAESHYFLQYHLYALAVSRFLARYEPGFDYEKNFGGALYLFVKGMRPGRSTGVFFEKPPLARLRALSRAFGSTSW
ncbi:MAG TPA: UvrD-helicase domain-containing protein [Polyangiaceae bacterium]